jgi:hypothetical protein
MHLKGYPLLLRVRLPWFRIVRVTFYILQTILNIRLGKFMLVKVPYAREQDLDAA